MKTTIAWICTASVPALLGCGGGGGGGDEDTGTDAAVDPDADGDGETEVLPDGVECTSDGDCDNGVFCDGEETCEAGSCVDGTMACDDDDPCTTDVCNEDDARCDHEEVDADGDGYPAAEVDGTACGGSDCDDGDDGIHPDAALDCAGGGDFDCDGMPDIDEDGDGHEALDCGGDDCDDGNENAYPGYPYPGCTTDDQDCNGFEDHDNDGDGDDRLGCGAGRDCDDGDPEVYYGAVEIDCDGRDNDCSGEMSDVEDTDRDGYAEAGCARPGDEPDCDDDDPDAYPGAPEICDLVDQDCDGSWADGGADDDGDGVLDIGCGGPDCDDTNPDAHPGGTPACQDFDADCDGDVEQDEDGDGVVSEACGGTDCDDGNDAIHPGATPDCEAFDIDCDTIVENDHDADGHARVGCTGGDDCDDEDPDVSPSDAEVCLDGVDNDCDGRVDGPAVMLSGDVLVSGGGAATDNGQLPEIDWTGSEFGIAFQSEYGTLTTEQNIMTFDVAPTGALSFHGEAIFTDDPDLDWQPMIDWSGSRWGITWVRMWTASGIGVAFSTADADWTHAGPVDLVTDGREPTIAWGGSTWGVCWREDVGGGSQEYADVLCNRFDDTGLALGSDLTVGEHPHPIPDKEPQMVWAGSGWGVVWQVATSETPTLSEVYFRWLDEDMASAGSAVDVSESPAAWTFRPRLDWTGSQFVVTWSESTDSFTTSEQLFRLVDPDGSLPGVVEVVPGGASDVASLGDVLWTGSDIAFVWTDGRVGLPNAELYARIFAPDGSPVSDDVRVTFAPNVAYYPSLGWSGSEIGVTWEDDRDAGGEYKVYFQRIGFCE